MAAGDTQMVMSPRQTSARSEAAPFWTWYCVLYVGWTLDFIHPVWSAPSQPHSGFVHQRRARPPLLSTRHGRPQRRHPPRTRGGIPADRNRWVRGLRWGECAPLGVGVRLWSRAQDSAERSRRPSRTAPEDRPGGSAAGCAVGVGGFRDPAHLVRRASHPHDSPRLGVLAPSLALPRPGRRPAPRARRPLALLLQSGRTGRCSSVERPGRQRCTPAW